MVRERLHLTHLFAAAIVVGALGRLVVRMEVAGESMLPAFEPGDRVVALRCRRLAPGDAVVLRDPRKPERLVLKRVAAAGPAGIDVRGDNPAASTDSRQWGSVAAGAVIGRVVYRYAPTSRAGRIQSRR
ncbi:MAG: nickel-type superoxide dismutase maturation protease [Acidimicrobiaceae bacterium]|nr:nickel-type superoxide dismutase maturation protease [Acidimicrobiaceae bacterium]